MFLFVSWFVIFRHRNGGNSFFTRNVSPQDDLKSALERKRIMRTKDKGRGGGI